MPTIHESIELGKSLGVKALYFGCWLGAGHYLHEVGGHALYGRTFEDLPWGTALMDTGLLINGKVKDMPSGKVYWTCGGDKAFWYAFYWWDRSVDRRGNSHSGFYVRGFGYPEAQEAFDYACSQFPDVVKRQAFPLVLQNI